MKKYMMMAALAAATMSLTTSCSDDELVKMSTNDGDIINFTAVAKQSHATRTVYGPQNSNKSWPLYWIDKDEVKVFCPEANVQDGNVNVATYAVADNTLTKESSTTATYSISEAKDGKALHWGAPETHHFYEAYPAKNVSTITETKVTATIPATQHLTYQENGYYADMDAALMVGKTQVTKTAFEESGVDLPFEPIFTAVDIVIDPNERLTNDFHITSITVANAESETSIKPLAGEFTYKYDASDELKFASVSSATEAYNVQLEFKDDIVFNASTKTPLKVTAFLRGDYSNTVKVVINGYSENDGKKQYGTMKRQGTPTEPNHCLTKLARNSVNLGLLPVAFMPMTGEWWVSHTSDDIYVSDMSLPGSYDSGNFVEGTDGNKRTQTNSIAELLDTYKDKAKVPGSAIVNYQLNHGVRVFDMRLMYDADNKFYVNRNDNDSDYPNRTAHPNRSDHPNATILSGFLGYAVTWLKQHTTEFLIVFLQADNSDQQNAFDTNIQSEIERIMSGSESYYLKQYNSDIKVSEARGRILFVTVGGDNTPVIGNKVSPWSTEGNYGIQEKSFGYGSGTVYVHDINNLNTGTLSVAEPSKKRTAITNYLKSANDETSHQNWHVTCTAAHSNLSYSQCASGESQGWTNYALNWHTINQVKNHKKVGIVLGAYLCTGSESGGSHGQEFIDEIWNLNYK